MELGLYFKPFKVYTQKRTLKVQGGTSITLSKLNRHTKVVSPNADLLAVLSDFFGVVFDDSGYSESVVEVSPRKVYGKVPSIAGILRALLILKFRYPEVYRKFIKLAKYLSYEFSEEIKVPPLHLLLYYPTTGLEAVWDLVEAETGFSKELYAYAVYRQLRETPLGKLKTLFDGVSLFRPEPDEDKKAVNEFVNSFKPPAWFDESASLYSSIEDRIKADYHAVDYDYEQKVLKDAVKGLIDEIKRHLKVSDETEGTE